VVTSRFGKCRPPLLQAGCLFLGNAVERVQNADHPLSEQSHEREPFEPIVARPPRLRFSSACTMASVRSNARFELQSSARNLARAVLMRLEFHQARRDYLRQVAFLLRSATLIASSICLRAARQPQPERTSGTDCGRR